MLKLFLLLPLFTLNVAMTLGLIYFTAFIDPAAGLLASFIVLLFLSSGLVLIYEHGEDEYRDA